MRKPKDQEKLDMEMGEEDESVYDDTGREKLMEDDEISPTEEGFMEGAEDDGEQGKCAYCGAALMGFDTVETKINGKVWWFCSNDHADRFKERSEHKEEEE